MDYLDAISSSVLLSEREIDRFIVPPWQPG